MNDNAVIRIDVFEGSAESGLDRLAESWRARVEKTRSVQGFREAWLHRAVRPDTRFPVVSVARWDGSGRNSAAAEPQCPELLGDGPSGVDISSGLYEIIHEFRSAEGSPTGPGVTFMNIFEIDPAIVTGFAEGWANRARLMRSAPGFRDVALHRALSAETRFQLVNVAHWDSLELWEAATRQSAMRSATNEARTQATPNAAIYEVVAETL